MYVVDEHGQVLLSNVDEMLMRAYSYHKAAFEKHTQDNIVKFKQQINEYNIIVKIRPHVSVVSGKTNEIDDAYLELGKRTGESVLNIKTVMEKFKIKRLLTIKLDIADVTEKINELAIQLKNSDKVCMDMYDTLR
jgi:hypothetical protein